MSFLTVSGIFSIWSSHSLGNIIFLIPILYAARTFSLTPPTARTLPLRVISPVMAIFPGTGLFVRADMVASVIVIPADGPSFGVAPRSEEHTSELQSRQYL